MITYNYGVIDMKNIWDVVASSFGKVGPTYWNDFGEYLVEFSNMKSGSKVLDIGIGRGSSLFPTATKIGVTGHVVGIDNSQAMVSETQKEIFEKKLSNVEVFHMNADFLEFNNEKFDNVINGFGFGYIYLGKNGFKEIMRVLKPGGKASFSIWGIQEDQKWFSNIVEKYIKSEKGNNINYKFDTIDDVMKILKEARFKNIEIEEVNTTIVYNSKDEWWNEMNNNAVRGIIDCIEQMGEEIFTEFKKDVFEGLSKYETTEGFSFNMPVIYASGMKL